ncbi:MAG: hypothetical protein ACOCXD_00830 [Bacteroidota bacterium]
MLGILVIFFAPIDRYILEIPFVINLSFYRVSLILMITGFILQKLLHFSPTLKGRPLFYLLIFLYLFGLMIGMVQSNRLDDFSSYFLNEIMGLLIIVVFINIYSRKDIPTLFKAFVASFIFPLLTSLYVYFIFSTELRIIEVLPLSDVLPFLRTIEFDNHPFRFGLFPRLGLPYSTSPHLAVVASIILIIVLFYYKKTKRFVLAGAIFLILIGTLTRTVIVSLFLTFLVYTIFYLHDIGIRLLVLKKKYLFLLLMLVGGVIFLSQLEVFNMLTGRLTEGNLTEDRHFILIIEAFYILFDSVNNLLFGIGDGNLVFQDPVHTYLPPDSLLNSFLTLLVHRGLVGFFLNVSLYIYLLGHLINKRLVNKETGYALLFAFINVLFAFNFYELRFVNGVWILMGIIAVFVNDNAKNDRIPEYS